MEGKHLVVWLTVILLVDHINLGPAGDLHIVVGPCKAYRNKS
jgi:hypothetical protein